MSSMAQWAKHRQLFFQVKSQSYYHRACKISSPHPTSALLSVPDEKKKCPFAISMWIHPTGSREQLDQKFSDSG